MQLRPVDHRRQSVLCLQFGPTDRRDDLVEDVLAVGSGLPKPNREQGEPAAEYNQRLKRSGAALSGTMRSLREDPQVRESSPLARRAIYEQAFNAKQMERAARLSDESVQTERHIEGLKADAYTALREIPEYQRLSEKHKQEARRLISDELKGYRARVGSVDRGGRPRAEKPAQMPDWTPRDLAKAALQDLQK
jgi:hypothetical protein